MSKKGLSGVEMWTELVQLHGFLTRWARVLEDRTVKRKNVIKEITELAEHLANKIKADSKVARDDQ